MTMAATSMRRLPPLHSLPCQRQLRVVGLGRKGKSACPSFIQKRGKIGGARVADRTGWWRPRILVVVLVGMELTLGSHTSYTQISVHDRLARWPVSPTRRKAWTRGGALNGPSGRSREVGRKRDSAHAQVGALFFFFFTYYLFYIFLT
jgi:hypothetical protein